MPETSHQGHRLTPFVLAVVAATLVVVGVSFGFAAWSIACILCGLLIALGIGYGHVTRSWLNAISVGLVIMVAGTLTVGGAYATEWGQPLLAGGVIGLIILGATVLILSRSAYTGPEALHHPRATGHVSSSIDRADSRHILMSISQLHDTVSISDRARVILFGDRDAEVVAAAIEAHILAGDLDAARVLCDTVDRELADVVDTGALRAAIANATDGYDRDELQRLLQLFDHALAQHNWTNAMQLTAHVREIEIKPDGVLAEELEQRLHAARDIHKGELENRLRVASELDDLDTAMTILKELDVYMTREEAEHLSDEARSIVERHRERLGAAFQLALREKKWIDAARSGNQIIAEYPNTKMAQEVRTMIDVVRMRATHEAVNTHQ